MVGNKVITDNVENVPYIWYTPKHFDLAVLSLEQSIGLI